ncbi:AIM2 isoform 1 [Pan troglodytes]|uniref:Interferon-inducible protein AIM2 n=5 Tax=Pan troglodytes TaxID=9598 RepID=A0A6D2X978_PANTR|nr:interferon-inducible protein AIM2 [Pan paniscus]XP_016785498.2 interferon-inducible protein AIM2 isoform X1 [Pan troglodytes]XP_016785499.2 interferon-inducible protein AIM2 isoform X1 [Pan troglodytes]XP_034794116.1 interferon-inducible protein AIM2 [Pan paniscus]XP_054543359.1 interferon-inducible protein AIM2 isoform X1 [Pan troglodytes]XP_054543362.1 interferon-inducible protein AIM2 isoform X1 [Pan troglodytes]XP_054543366.1 interferon-inducible protein AIM2 isoform X1 [Pan troglodyte
MESKYKEILLLTGLDNITDEELDRFKFFLSDEFNIATGKLHTANRIQVANLMIQNAGAVSAVMKTIRIFQKLNYMLLAKRLQEEKEKVDKQYKSVTKPKPLSQAEMSPAASAAIRNDVAKQRAAPKVSPHAKPEQKQMVAQQESIREGFQKGCLPVMVLKAKKPFTFETQEGKQEMFHATVATEKEFFFVKVFNTLLKDKFIPKRIIIISRYYQHSGFLEVNSASRVLDAESDQKVNVPLNIIRKAGETPKINTLQTQPLGTIVNGLFVVQKVTEKKKNVLFDLSDNTGKMEVLVVRNEDTMKCKEGDKVRLTFFTLSKNGEKLQLTSGVHSTIKVIKAKKKT